MPRARARDTRPLPLRGFLVSCSDAAHNKEGRMRDPGGGQPSSLHAGDRVAVVAPSGPVDHDRLERGATVLRGLGLEVTFGRHVLDTAASLPHLAGTDADRAADLQDAWCDPRIAAVLCARGGYGATRVLDHLDWTALRRATPKFLHGSSDV